MGRRHRGHDHSRSTPETLVEYLGVLEAQLGVAISPPADRVRWATQLQAAVSAAAV
jgi:hypothetical protein